MIAIDLLITHESPKHLKLKSLTFGPQIRESNRNFHESKFSYEDLHNMLLRVSFSE